MACVTLMSRANFACHAYPSPQLCITRIGETMNSAAAILPSKEDEGQELIALARLLTYAKETAGALKSEVAVFCIESAIGAILEQLAGDAERALELRYFEEPKAAQH